MFDCLRVLNNAWFPSPFNKIKGQFSQNWLKGIFARNLSLAISPGCNCRFSRKPIHCSIFSLQKSHINQLKVPGNSHFPRVNPRFFPNFAMVKATINSISSHGSPDQLRAERDLLSTAEATRDLLLKAVWETQWSDDHLYIRWVVAAKRYLYWLMYHLYISGEWFSEFIVVRTYP